MTALFLVSVYTLLFLTVVFASLSDCSNFLSFSFMKGVNDYGYIAVLGRGHFGKVNFSIVILKTTSTYIGVCTTCKQCIHCMFIYMSVIIEFKVYYIACASLFTFNNCLYTKNTFTLCYASAARYTLCVTFGEFDLLLLSLGSPC